MTVIHRKILTHTIVHSFSPCFKSYPKKAFQHVSTFVALGVPGHFYGVVSGEDATGTGSHVVALIPVILRLDLHQQRIVHVQLQLVVMSRDKPVETDLVMQGIEGTSQAFFELDDRFAKDLQHKHISGCPSAWAFGSFEKEYFSEICVSDIKHSATVRLKSGS